MRRPAGSLGEARSTDHPTTLRSSSTAQRLQDNENQEKDARKLSRIVKSNGHQDEDLTRRRLLAVADRIVFGFDSKSRSYPLEIRAKAV